VSRVVIGTRGSALAKWQANFVRRALLATRDDLRVDLEIIRTKGDAILHVALHEMLDKGLFTKEIEAALLAGRIDLAVHSLKDLPTDLPDGLALAAIPAREDPADVLVSKHAATLDDLPPGAEVLSGSLRRRAQLLHRRSDLKVLPVRGNVQTRLRKLDESGAEGMILARAGLARLGLLDRATRRLDPNDFLPACGQGALAIEIRSDDPSTADLLKPLDDAFARVSVTAERTFLAALGGGCQVPLGAHARLDDDGSALTLTGMVASLDGRRLLRRTVSAPLAGPHGAEALGRQLADGLLADGCREILDEIAAQSPGQPPPGDA